MTGPAFAPPKFHLQARCNCQDGALPLRAIRDTVIRVRIQLATHGPVPAALLALPIIDYRCRGCKAVVAIALGDLLGLG